MKPLMTTLQVEGEPIYMEIDTAASVFVMSRDTWKSEFSWLTLNDVEVTVRSYSSELLSVLGQTDVSVVHGDKTVTLSISVIEGSGPTSGWLDLTCGSRSVCY